MPSRPELPLHSQAKIERRRAIIQPPPLWEFGHLPEALIALSTGQAIKKRPAIVKTQVIEDAVKLFDAYAEEYLELPDASTNLRDWLDDLRATIEDEVIGERNKHDIFAYHCPVDGQRKAIRDALEQRTEGWLQKVATGTEGQELDLSASQLNQMRTPDSKSEKSRPGLRPTKETRSVDARATKEARAKTVAKIIQELNRLKPQMFEDESEYNRLHAQYPDFLTFRIAADRPDLKLKVLAIRGSTRHFRLAQELAAAHYGRAFSTIQDDWKHHKPAEFNRHR